MNFESFKGQKKCFVCDGTIPKYFSERSWGRFRGIVFDGIDLTDVKITGFSHGYSINDGLVVPTARGETFGSHTSPTVSFSAVAPHGLGRIGVAWLSRTSQGYLGYPVHTMCWEILESVLGPIADEDASTLLEAIITVFDKKYKEARKGGMDWGRDGSTWLPDVPIEYRKNPLRNPAITSLVYRLAGPNRRADEQNKKKKKKMETKEQSRDSEGQQTNLVYFPSSMDVFPYEIRTHVLSYLHGKDLFNAVSGLGWSFESSFWKSRIRRDIFFEVEKYRFVEYVIDWKKVLLALEKMRENPTPGLQTRIIIFERVFELQKEYRELKSRC